MSAALWALAAVVTLAFGVQTAIGFGSMIVGVTLGAAWMPLDELIARLVPLSVAQGLWVLLRHGWAVRWRLLGARILPWMGLGLGVGAGAIGPGGAPGSKPALGVLVLTLAAVELWRGRRAAVGARWQATLALIGSGLVQGVLATGGPLLVWALGREDLDRHAFRSTMTAVWVVLNGVLVALMAARGQVDAASLTDTALLLIPMGLGIALGEGVHARLDEDRFRRALWGLLAVASLPLLFGG